jgi:phage baseplate assembly protein W
MTLPETNEIDNQFFKTLNEDIQLKPNSYGEFDIVFEDYDVVNVTGLESLANAITILIMTRYGELKHNLLYNDDFGCRVHQVVKDNISNLNTYKIEKYVEESIKRMRRVKRINYIRVKPKQNGYEVVLSVLSINDEDLNLKLELK